MTSSSELVQAVERLRDDNPMGPRAKLGPPLGAEGLAVSDATVGRILADLIALGVAEPVPGLHRQPDLDAFPHRYVRYRPHGALGGSTPVQYLQSLSGGPPPSHMS